MIHCNSFPRKVQHIEVRLFSKVNGNKKGFGHYTSNKGNLKNGLDPLLGKEVYLS